MMVKRAEFLGRNVETGAPLVHLIDPGDSSAYGLMEVEGIKAAADTPMVHGLRDLIASIKPKPGTLYLVNSAIVSGEYTGFNARGDWFTREGLMRVPKGWHDLPVTIDALDARRRLAAEVTEVPGWGRLAWGYPTFLNAHRFQHHVNLDPQKARGFTLGAFWDDRMSRVILVTELVRSLCEHNGDDAVAIYDRIKRGEYPDTSMACRVPYDQCSICGFVARIPADYCVHAKTAMRRLDGDGRRTGVYNHYPNFFDDSFVFIGAERAAKMMMRLDVNGDGDYGRNVYRSNPLGGPSVVRVAALERAAKSVGEKPSSTKAASAGLVTSSSMGDLANPNLSARRDLYEPGQAEELARMLRPQAKRTDSPAAQLAEITRGVPVQNSEAAVRRFVARRLSWIAAERDGRRTEPEARSWEQKARDYLRSKYSMTASDLEASEARVMAALVERYSGKKLEDPTAPDVPTSSATTTIPSMSPATKVASCSLEIPLLAVKRGEIVKELPPAHPFASDVIMAMDDKLKPLSREALDALAGVGPYGPQIALRVGILLSPAEWQYTQVRPVAPELAIRILTCGPTFSSRDFVHGVDCDLGVPSAMDDLSDLDISGYRSVSDVLSALLPFIAGRSVLGDGIERARARTLPLGDLPPIREPLFARSPLHDTHTRHTLGESLSAGGYGVYRRGALADLPELRYLWGSRGSAPMMPLWRHLFT
jgi:hypothetical protein